MVDVCGDYFQLIDGPLIAAGTNCEGPSGSINNYAFQLGNASSPDYFLHRGWYGNWVVTYAPYGCNDGSDYAWTTQVDSPNSIAQAIPTNPASWVYASNIYGWNAHFPTVSSSSDSPSYSGFKVTLHVFAPPSPTTRPKGGFIARDPEWN